MEKSFENTDDHTESIKRFEQMVQNDYCEYLEVHTYCHIIQYYHQYGQFEKALKACNIGLEQHPFSLELKLLLTNSLLESGNFHDALGKIDEILIIQPTDVEYQSTKAEVLLYLDRYQESIDIYEKILPLSDEKAQVYYQLSEGAQGLHNHELAISYLLESLKLNPSNEEAMFELYHSYEALGKLDECILQIDIFIDNNPFSQHAWYNLGILYDKQEDYKKAIDSYEFAVAIDDQLSSAYYNMGVAYMSLKEYEKAIIPFNQAKEQEKYIDPYLYQSLGHCYFETENFSLSLKHYHKGLNENPSMHESWYGIGLILEQQEKWMEAVHFFEKAHKSQETNSKYLKALAQTEYQLGNITSSLENFKKAIYLDDKDVNTWTSWSYVYHEQGETDLAVQVIIDAIEELPEEAELYYRLSCYLIVKGNLKEAFIYLENALILDFEMHTVLFEFFQDLETQKALVRVIDQYRKD